MVVEEVIIPPIENMPADSARQTLLFFGLDMEIIEEIYRETIPDDYIINQDPETNVDIHADRIVKVVISMGSEASGISVPNILGLEIEGARGILEAMGLKAGTISGKYSEESARDYVIEQNPAFGGIADYGDAVDIIISEGSQTIIIPNIIGLGFLYASNHLESLGINIVTSKTPLTEEISQPGLVVSVIPQPGTGIKAGSTVELKISTSEPLNEVPDLTGLDLGQASEELDLLGIGMEISYIDADYSFQQGEVLYQWPLPGNHISKNSTVVLFIGK